MKVVTNSIGFAIALAEKPPPEPQRCGWCDVHTRDLVGLCTCTEPCGIVCCPARRDDYAYPAVPRFR